MAAVEDSPLDETLALRQPGCAPCEQPGQHREATGDSTTPACDSEQRQGGSTDETETPPGSSSLSTVTPRHGECVFPGVCTARDLACALRLSPWCAALLLFLFSLRNLKNHQYKNHEMPQFLLELSYLPSSFFLNIENISIKLGSPTSSSP